MPENKGAYKTRKIKITSKANSRLYHPPIWSEDVPILPDETMFQNATVLLNLALFSTAVLEDRPSGIPNAPFFCAAIQLALAT